MDAKYIQLKTFFAVVFSILVLEAAGGTIPVPETSEILKIGVLRILEIAALAGIVIYLQGNTADIGIAVPTIFAGIRRGVLWSIGFGLLVAASGLVLLAFGINPLALVVMKLPGDVTSICIFFIVGGIIGPVAEEVFFRGIIFRFFRPWGFAFALFFSTAIFALLHLATSAVPIPQLVGGILFASAFEIEKNLLAPITIHIIANLTIFSLSYLTI